MKLSLKISIILCFYTFTLNAQVKDTVQGITVTIPKGWSKVPSKTSLAALYKSDKPRVSGDKLTTFMFTVRINSVPEKDILKIKKIWMTMMAQQTEKLNEALKPASKGLADLVGANKFTIKDIKINEHPAFQMTLNSVLKVQENFLKMDCKTIVFLIDDKMYIVAANFALPKEEGIEKIRDQFLQSIQIDKAGVKK